ncbi:MAG: hypothetical protein V4691_07805 [Pseudomonadota bacterium]
MGSCFFVLVIFFSVRRLAYGKCKKVKNTLSLQTGFPILKNACLSRGMKGASKKTKQGQSPEDDKRILFIFSSDDVEEVPPTFGDLTQRFLRAQYEKIITVKKNSFDSQKRKCMSAHNFCNCLMMLKFQDENFFMRGFFSPLSTKTESSDGAHDSSLDTSSQKHMPAIH